MSKFDFRVGYRAQLTSYMRKRARNRCRAKALLTMRRYFLKASRRRTPKPSGRTRTLFLALRRASDWRVANGTEVPF